MFLFLEAIEAHWTEWTMCTVGAKSRDRTLQDGCLIDECETVTEECIPQGKDVTFPVATFILFLIHGMNSFGTLQHYLFHKTYILWTGYFAMFWIDTLVV
jgi:hypothetical protein